MGIHFDGCVATVPFVCGHLRLARHTCAELPAIRTIRGWYEGCCTDVMPKVLLVEDDQCVRDVLCRAFEQTGWTVLSAATPREARTLAMAQPVDLMVTDVMLPEMDGFQLAEQIVKAQPHVPVIFMSGYSEKYLPVRVPISSPASILAKPFPFQTLLLRATHMIMRRPAAAVPAFVSH